MTSHRAFLEELYEVAIAAAHPGALAREAVDQLLGHEASGARVAIIALGKAAPAMAEAAVEHLAAHGAGIIGGVVVGAEGGPSPHPLIRRVAGDHPLPLERSRAAAALLGAEAQRARDESDVVLVLLSGGATSLAGAPVEGISAEQLIALYEALLGSGWDIGAMNAVRKRFLRWGAGRLAAALAPRPVHLAMLSDVIGDDPATIASGPCTPDPLTASDVLDRIARLTAPDEFDRRPFVEYLERVVAGEIGETPKPDDIAFANVLPPIVTGNMSALAAVADHADRAGWIATVSVLPMRGDARAEGALTASVLLGNSGAFPRCIIRGGETTVTLDRGTAGMGGRCQELALAAAQVLATAPAERRASVTLLAAGTDGRDGPTDAAGAIVDGETWARADAAGSAPQLALDSHDSYRALTAAGAILPARSTGTNVMDIVVGLVGDVA